MRYIQPQSGPFALDRGNSITSALSDIWIGSSIGLTLVKGVQGARSGSNSSPTTVIEGIGPGGRHIRGDGTTTLAGWKINGNSNDLLDNSNTTWFIVRRCRDTTVRSSYMHYGYDSGASNRALVGAPEGTNLTWDYGNATAGSGRLQAPYTKDTQLETLVLVAGQTKGREIWRRGVKLASNTSAKAVRSADAAAFGIGPMNSATPFDDVETYLFGISNREWSDAEIICWCANPWQLFKSPQRVMMVGFQTYTFTPSGGIALSGAGSALRSTIKTPAGGLVFSGAAPSSRSVVKTASGGIAFAGTAAQVRSATRTTSGGITLGGAATVLRGLVKTASGGILFGGAASVSFHSAVQTLIVTPVGGMVFAGTAAIVRTCTRAVSGGISLAGNASVVLSHFGAVVGNWISVARHRRRD